jgi:hypothetical protein
MTKVELRQRVTELEQEVGLWRHYAAATHESHRLGPIVIVPESFDRSILLDVRIYS